LTNLNRAIAEATAKRDQLAADIARRAFPARTTEGWVTAETVIAQAVDDALRSGWDAYRHWIDGEWDPLIVVQRDCQSDTVSGDVPQQQDKAERNALDRVPLPNPDSFAGFHAWRAALSTLRVRVTVNQVEANAPRWVARMMLPGGAIEGVCATHSPI
jgi:hypothetical protein